MKWKELEEEVKRLLLEQVAIDEAREHRCLLVGGVGDLSSLMDEVIDSEYSNVHPAWAIQLYLERN